MNNTEALLALNAVRGLGNTGVRKLLERYGSAINVLSLSEGELAHDPLIPSKVIKNIIHFSQDTFLKAEYDLMKKRYVKIVTFLDEEYPETLREIADAPVVLYVKGDLSRINPLSIGIVGSRKASFYGLETSEKFAGTLAEYGITVVSGLARGIDTAAHNGTLRARGITIAVLGCGLSNIYPLENKDLLEQIAETGAVLSEFPMQTMPMAHNFPRRNRIISGLSTGVIVVEAAKRSGALITADFALEQGREVYAIPGKIDHAASQGANDLIKQGAKLITSVDDVLEDINPKIQTYLNNRICEQKNPKLSEDQLKELSEEEKSVFGHISERPIHIDELINCCNSSVPVMSVLLQLELKQLVKQLPGKLFKR